MQCRIPFQVHRMPLALISQVLNRRAVAHSPTEMIIQALLHLYRTRLSLKISYCYQTPRRGLSTRDRHFIFI